MIYLQRHHPYYIRFSYPVFPHRTRMHVHDCTEMTVKLVTVIVTNFIRSVTPDTELLHMLLACAKFYMYSCKNAAVFTL
jgi:hypothetical protein